MMAASRRRTTTPPTSCATWDPGSITRTLHEARALVAAAGSDLDLRAELHDLLGREVVERRGRERVPVHECEELLAPDRHTGLLGGDDRRPREEVGDLLGVVDGEPERCGDPQDLGH